MSDLNEAIMNSINDADEILNSFAVTVVEKAQQAVKPDLNELKFNFEDLRKEIDDKIEKNVAVEAQAVQALQERIEIIRVELQTALQLDTDGMNARLGAVEKQISELESLFRKSSENILNDLNAKLLKQKRTQFILFGIAIIISVGSALLAALALLIR
jgi:hypothetical protein